MWLFNISKTWYDKFRDHRGGLNLDWKIIYTFVRGELEKDFETLSLSRGWNPRRRICTSEGQHRCIACTSTRSYFFFSSFFSPLLLNTRILSTRSFRSGFRVFRLSGVTSSSRGSLIKSRWKFWVSGHPLTQFRGLPRWEIIGGSNWPRNNKLSIGEISKTDTFSTIDSIYFIYFQFKGEIQEWTKRFVVQALSSRYFSKAIFVQNYPKWILQVVLKQSTFLCFCLNFSTRFSTKFPPSVSSRFYFAALVKSHLIAFR